MAEDGVSRERGDESLRPLNVLVVGLTAEIHVKHVEFLVS